MSDLSVWTDEDHPTDRPHRRKKKPHRKGAVAVVLSLLVIFGLLAAGAAALMGAGSKLKDAFSTTSAPDFPGPGDGEVQIEVKQGETVGQVARTLKDKGVVKSVDAMVQVANGNPDSADLQPGFYKLQRHMTASDALTALLDPSARVLARVTVPEGLRADEIVTLLSAKTKIPKADFTKALKNGGALGLPAYAKGRAEGFLFPATYDVQPGSSATTVLKAMVARYQQAAKSLDLAHKDLPPYDVVTIASMLEAEVKFKADYAKVSRVVRNHLADGTPIGFDSTMLYYFKNGQRELTTKDFQINTPYNTRIHVGLPPTPISSPGEATLKAAANPPPGNWLYFVTVNLKTGETKFTNSYKEFLKFRKQFKDSQ